MKIQFNSKIDYQLEAISSVVDIFEGIETGNNYFSIKNMQQSFDERKNVYSSNWIHPDWMDIAFKNIKKIQEKNKLIFNIDFNAIKKNKCPIFDIEMETGTGKTYVFLRTILELNKKYNFRKFVIIVPSIAIKEGVKKTLDITKDDFKVLYNVCYDYFEYEGAKSLEYVKEFGNDTNIKILIINIQSFDKSDNILKKYYDGFCDELPISSITKTKPIIIIDEPQTTSNTKNRLDSIYCLDPLFILRYSATFRKRLNNEILLYKLSPIDAYNKRLVKEIVVHGQKNNISSNIHAKVLSITNDKNELRVKFLLKTINNKNGNEQYKEKILKQKDDLYFATNNTFFKNKNFIIDEINIDKNNELNSKVIFSNGEIKKVYDLIGNPIESINNDIDILLKRNQIEKTIRLHLEKQLELYDQKIKVLSLFFIDDVNKYRHKEITNDNTKIILGEYGNIFEELFVKIALDKKYEKLFLNKNIEQYVKKVHDGYFSIDSKKREVNSKGNGENAKLDAPTYIKIMREKEMLLSFDEDLCFIFSHSALKEGWDNPNVFQICTLNDSKSDIKKRQEIGRGLRLCVNDKGERINDELINKLSIITNESYEEFANSLQKEFENDGVFSKNIESFLSNNYTDLSIDEKKEIILFFKNEGFLNKNNSIKKEFLIDVNERKKLIEKTISNNKNLDINLINIIITEYAKQFVKSKKYIKNGDEKIVAKANLKILNSIEFNDFINTINYKSVYKTNVDTNELIDRSIQKIKENLNNNVSNSSITNEEVSIDKIENNKLHEGYNKKNLKEIKNNNFSISINEWIEIIENSTKITKKSILKIICQLLENKYLQIFLEKDIFAVRKAIIDGINYIKNKIIFENIIYEKTDERFNLKKIINESGCKLCYYPNDISDYVFPKSKILKENSGKDKSPYDILKLDSKNEENYLEKTLIPNISYKIFFKFPDDFYILTPIGKYSPDWGIYNDAFDKKYFICETKGSNDEKQLREIEKQKIECARKHFECLGESMIDFQVKSSNE